jgi:F0F1-type ATP synthase assembly protein I
LFGGIGYFIDKSNESYPFWTSISAAVGAVIAIINFIRKVLMFSKADEERKKKERLSRLENEKD